MDTRTRFPRQAVLRRPLPLLTSLFVVASLAVGCAHGRACTEDAECGERFLCSGHKNGRCLPRCDPTAKENPCPSNMLCLPQEADPKTTKWACSVYDT